MAINFNEAIRYQQSHPLNKTRTIIALIAKKQGG